MNNPNHMPPLYSLWQRRLHWIIAPLILCSLYTGFFWGGRVLWHLISPTRLHMTLGVIILLLTVMRLILRAKHTVPKTSITLFVLIAKLTHALLYLLIMVQALSGISGYLLKGKTITLLGGLVIPPLLPKGVIVTKLFFQTHNLVGPALLGLVALHITAALIHQLFLRDRLISRMWG